MNYINPLADDLDAILDQTRSLWEDLRDSRIFITGGTGFFGCWLLETFCWANRHLNLGSQAVVLSRNPSLFQRKAPHLASDSAVKFIAGDIRNFALPEETFSHVIHAATEASATLNEQNPCLMLKTNVEGTGRCLELAEKSGARRFLLTSSGAVYGKQPSDLTHIAEIYSGGPDPLSKSSAYAEGKRMAELQCALAYKVGVLEPVIARCFAFVGPYMKLDAHFAIGNFIRDQLEGKPIIVKGDGTPFRSYLYAGDLMVWLWTLLFRGEPCRAYNVGSDQAISIAELAGLVANSGNASVSVEIREMPSNLPPLRYVPSTERARRELGLSERTRLADAIRKTRHWRRSVSALHV